MGRPEKEPNDRSTSRASTLKLESDANSQEKLDFKSLTLKQKVARVSNLAAEPFRRCYASCRSFNPKKTISFVWNFLTVEPFLVCYILPGMISAVAVQRLNLEKACRVNLNYTEEICNRVVTGDVANLTDESAGSQYLVAEMTAWKTPLQSGIPCLVILFVGAWSDRTGNRKAVMLIPVIGDIVVSIGLILANYYFNEWPLFITALIEAVPAAFTGGLSICLMAVYSFMADVTTVQDRTFRIGLVAVIATLSIPLGTSVSGFLLEALGYYGIFGLNLVFYSIALVYAYFRIHNVEKEVEPVKHPLLEFFHPKHVYNTLVILFVRRSGTKRLRVWLVLLVHLVIVGPVYAEGLVSFLYTLEKYHFDVIMFSLFATYSTLVGLLGTTIAITLFSKKLKMDDNLIGLIATVCLVGSSFVYAFAPDRLWFFSGPIFNIFGNSGVTAIRSIGTKIVEPSEVGRMASIIGLVEAFAPVTYTPLYSKVYAATVKTVPGTFYILGGIMTIPAFAIFLSMYWLQKKASRDIVKDPSSKEQYAHDNEITKL